MERPVLKVIVQGVRQVEQEQHPRNLVVIEQVTPRPRPRRRSWSLFDKKGRLLRKKRASWTQVRTISVYIRVLSEAILHRLELFDAINTLGILLRKHETGKRLAELHAARTVGHPTETRTVPVNFPGHGVKRTPRGRFFSLFRGCTIRVLVYVIFLGLWDVRMWCRKRL